MSCKCGRFREGKPYDASQCWECWLRHIHQRAINRAGKVQAAPVMVVPARPRRAAIARPKHKGTCRFLGEGLREGEGRPRLQTCPSCPGRVQLKVFACGHPVHGPETTSRRCETCPGFEPKEST
jgi:hypothetical protein